MLPRAPWVPAETASPDQLVWPAYRGSMFCALCSTHLGRASQIPPRSHRLLGFLLLYHCWVGPQGTWFSFPTSSSKLFTMMGVGIAVALLFRGLPPGHTQASKAFAPSLSSHNHHLLKYSLFSLMEFSYLYHIAKCSLHHSSQSCKKHPGTWLLQDLTYQGLRCTTKIGLVWGVGGSPGHKEPCH